MGRLLRETPFSEIVATLELLDGLGITGADLKKFRTTTAHNRGELVKVLRAIDLGIPFPFKVALESSEWYEQDGVIYLSVTSDGTTGPEWIKRLEKKGFRLSDYAKSVLRSPDFKPTKGVTTEIAILKGMLFEDRDRITSNIRDSATQRKLSTPNAEVACLIRDNFSDEDIEAMGLIWIVIMHEPIKDSVGGPSLLLAGRGDGGRWLSACCDEPGYGWRRGDGFPFVVSQLPI